MYTGPILRGHVFWIRIQKEHIVGHEQYKPRPWIVVSPPKMQPRRMGLIHAVPISSQTHQLAGFHAHRLLIPESEIVALPGQKRLHGDSLVLAEQLRALSDERLEEDPVAQVSKEYLLKLEACLAYVLGLPG